MTAEVTNTHTVSPTQQHEINGIKPELQLRMHHYFEASCDATPEATALEWEGGKATYAQLDASANQVAHFLRSRGVEPEARVGLFLPRSHLMYMALLGVMKAGAAFVPIDPSSPTDRVEYVATDADLDLLVTVAEKLPVVEGLDVKLLVIDDDLPAVQEMPTDRPELDLSTDPGAYVIYTSGSSGRPKGVDIAQSSICNFLQVITEVYGVMPSDRVYQGMTISFDFAIEEVWPTWAVGATLIAGPNDGRRVGEGLTEFLEDHNITVLYCVPTVLSTVDRTIPSIRALMVGGEACPSELVERWSPGRRMLNTYGPTETTVTCTWGVLLPGRPVTIGIPVPTYTAMILDENRQPVPHGEDGELVIGGIGVGRGYLNRPDLTADKFIEHPTDPSQGRVYRTGDLARFQDDGEIVYLGRADDEVKIRGHRVDLGEIESVMMRDPQVPTAAIKHLKGGAAGDELAAYLVITDPRRSDKEKAKLLGKVHDAMRETLPPYMVPAYMETIGELPMLPSGKVDRKNLPDPTSPRIIGGSGDVVGAETPMEEWVRSVWAASFGVPEDALSVTADFFDDLGGHSLVAATVTSKLRSDSRAGGMSVLDLYGNPTVRSLAEHLTAKALLSPEEGLGVEEQRAEIPRVNSGKIALFGFAQFVFVFVNLVVTSFPVAFVYWWHGGVPTGTMLRDMVLAFPVGYLVSRWVIPLATAKLFANRLREGSYPMYGWAHLQVWLVGKAMQLSPMANLAGSAFASAYLRMCGARIGDACHIGTADIQMPSMLTMDDDVTIGYGATVQGHYFRDGRLHVGRVHLQNHATIAANCVVSGPCTIGRHSILREQSSMRAGENLPSGETWQGSPARKLPSIGEPVFELMAGCGDAPREWDSGQRKRFTLGLVALELLPIFAMIPILVLVWTVLLEFSEWVAVIVTVFTGPVFVGTVCLLILGLRRFGLPHAPPGVHHLRSRLGVEKWFADKLLEASLLYTNTLYSTLFTPMWLRKLGARIGPRAEVSTIANIDPDLLVIGAESFVADMASVGSATYCNGHVAFRPTTVATRAFVGNASFVPSGSHLGSDSLLGVGSTPPVNGVPEGTSWLGSPSIFLPRREVYDEFTEEETFKPKPRQVAARYAIEFLRIVMPSSILALSLFGTFHFTGDVASADMPLWVIALAMPAIALVMSLVVVLFVALMKWAVVGRYKPRVEPLWNFFVRRSEFVTGVFEAAAVPALLQMLTGTPMLGPLLRLYGVKVGRRTLIDTTYITEFDLVRIGNDTIVGSNVSLQTHLFEDRVMKMHIVDVEDRVTLGSRSVVLYDTHVREEALTAPLTLVMKGEELPAGTAWAGIPAQPARRVVRSADPTETEVTA
ncbi:MAG: amino acid adenylation domain-containing protein [Dermatophilus congolensis]|nr:amino acid adenylation domain-containing protein [Dermatophilus congolensis]